MNRLPKIPTRKEFCKMVEECEEKHGIINCVYSKCIEEFGRIQPLSKLKEEQANRIIKTFLVNWGRMERRLGKKKKGIDGIEEIRKKLVCLSTESEIEKFRKKKLLHTRDSELEEHRQQISDLYEQIRHVKTFKKKKKGQEEKEKQDFGPTGAAKILHLSCPDFFPPWDEGIRTKLGFDDEDEAKDYFNFMRYVQKIWIRRIIAINKLADGQRGDSRIYPIGIIDEYLWEKFVGKNE